MPKLLIVDDETIFRKGLQHMIAEMDSDWIVVAEARDGLEALEKAGEYKPDFIITDMRMPRMDGVQLQYILKERYPDIRCIVMSGYTDFQYARESLRLGAKDYLLKPIEREVLYETLEKLKTEWVSDKVKLEALPQAPEEDKQTRLQLRQHILSSLITGKVLHEELELLDHIGLSFPHANFCCLIANMDRDSVPDERFYRVSPSLFALYICQFIQEIVNEHKLGYVFILSDTRVVALLNYEADIEAHNEVIQLAKRIGKDIKMFSNLTLTIGVGNEAHDLESVSKSFKEAEMALLHSLMVGGDRVLSYKMTAIHNSRKMEGGSINWKLLEQSIQEGNARDAKLNAKKLINDLCNQTSDPEVIQQQICKMLLHFYEHAVNLNIVKEWLKENDIRHVLAEIFTIYSRNEIIVKCQELLAGLSAEILERRVHIAANSIDTVVQYVQEHYTKPITLSMMAEKVYLNPSYLSTLFKNRLGQSFIDFLTEKRIEEAKKQLLHSDEKIAAIADATGFLNIRHFNRVFKAATQKTPKEYRDQR